MKKKKNANLLFPVRIIFKCRKIHFTKSTLSRSCNRPYADEVDLAIGQLSLMFLIWKMGKIISQSENKKTNLTLLQRFEWICTN